MLSEVIEASDFAPLEDDLKWDSDLAPCSADVEKLTKIAA
jgi:hypothetical protein